MEQVIDILKKFYKEIIILVILIALGIMTFLYFTKEPMMEEKIITVEEKEEANITTDVYVDIKGYVKNPGVYKVSSDAIVNDVISMAGGLTKKATTKNINLSKTVTSEMVIIISSKSALAEALTKEEVTCECDAVDITECLENETTSVVVSEDDTKITEEQNEATTKISINTATKEELMTLSGIGESKALNIISYREDNGNFQTIEEIMNVTGIGESIFAQIKENITV